MSKLIGTRIRKEESSHKTEYFPEYCLEKKTWYGKVKQEWYGVSDMSSHYFGDAYRAVYLDQNIGSDSFMFAQKVIDHQAAYSKKAQEVVDHEETKQTTYIKYP